MPDRIAEAYTLSDARARAALEAYRVGRWCGECQYGVVEEPPCCYREGDTR